MHPALVIAGKDLRQRVRDRSAIVLGFVAPVAIAALMSLAFRTTEDFHATVGYVSLDKGALAGAFHDMLTGAELRRVVTVREFGTEAAARAAVDRATVQAAYVVPAGFTAAAHGGAAVDVTVLASVDESLRAQVVRSLAESFVAQVNANRLAVAAAITAGAPLGRLTELATAAAELRLPVEVKQRSPTARPVKTISYYAPGMGIFFVLFAVGFGSRSWFLEKRDGTLDRVTAAPIGVGTVLLGKSLSTFCYALASLATMAVLSSLVFRADWGSPLAVAALCVATACAVVALTAFVTAVARTERQADGLASIVVFALALAGGNFVFLSVAPPVLRRLALFTPNGWALRGFTDLAAGMRGFAAVGRPVAAILGFTLALGLVTAALTRQLVRR